jgi:hypothetical protein
MSWADWTEEQTADNFRALFPEFERASDALIESRIAMAAEVTLEEVWGDLLYQGLAYGAAAMLCELPIAQDMRRASDGGSVYRDRRQALELTVSAGFRIAGFPETPYP